jgi:hypothetical protein
MMSGSSRTTKQPGGGGTPTHSGLQPESPMAGIPDRSNVAVTHP